MRYNILYLVGHLILFFLLYLILNSIHIYNLQIHFFGMIDFTNSLIFHLNVRDQFIQLTLLIAILTSAVIWVNVYKCLFLLFSSFDNIINKTIITCYAAANDSLLSLAFVFFIFFTYSQREVLFR